MKSEDKNDQCILRFSERPRFLIQAAADPSFPNKCRLQLILTAQ
jgi:hypothetical protein